MKEKFLQFFTGKMSKSIYISIAAAVVCVAVVITSTVIVHNNNQKIDAMQESLASSESVSKSAVGSSTEAENDEPAGDRALQYLAEYEKLTAEYKRKRAELAKETLLTQTVPTAVFQTTISPERPPYEPQSRARAQGGSGNYLETEEEYNAYLAEFQKQHSQWEQEYQRWEQNRQQKEAEEKEARRKAEAEEKEAQRKADEEKARASEAKKKLDALDAQYEKDVAALKARYGIA